MHRFDWNRWEMCDIELVNSETEYIIHYQNGFFFKYICLNRISAVYWTTTSSKIYNAISRWGFNNTNILYWNEGAIERRILSMNIWIGIKNNTLSQRLQCTKYCIYHGSYELTYLNQRFRSAFKFLSKIHGIYGFCNINTHFSFDVFMHQINYSVLKIDFVLY